MSRRQRSGRRKRMQTAAEMGRSLWFGPCLPRAQLWHKLWLSVSGCACKFGALSRVRGFHLTMAAFLGYYKQESKSLLLLLSTVREGRGMRKVWEVKWSWERKSAWQALNKELSRVTKPKPVFRRKSFHAILIKVSLFPEQEPCLHKVVSLHSDMTAHSSLSWRQPCNPHLLSLRSPPWNKLQLCSVPLQGPPPCTKELFKDQSTLAFTLINIPASQLGALLISLWVQDLADGRLGAWFWVLLRLG